MNIHRCLLFCFVSVAKHMKQTVYMYVYVCVNIYDMYIHTYIYMYTPVNTINNKQNTQTQTRYHNGYLVTKGNNTNTHRSICIYRENRPLHHLSFLTQCLAIVRVSYCCWSAGA